MTKIKDLPKVDQPREKLAKYGPGRLSDSELLAIILRTGIKGVNVVELAGRILRQIGGKNLTSVTLEELKKIKGLGPTKAGQILASLELGKRLLKDKKAVLHLSPKDVYEQLRDIRDLKKEHFVILFLDSRSQEIKRETISVGTLNASLVHPREVFEPAIKCNSAQIIVAHNHPSGDPEPSNEDIEITKRLVKAGELMGIELVDHIVVASKSFKSFRQENLI
jgi:DNA repair protein RadC